ncbi:uncharacterized protein [Saccopteryx bilineata]|uniref:uncharacterized protein n=1 Tax=Saccopteryx bilineata TaxID=59482 RepID=UPI00338E7309
MSLLYPPFRRLDVSFERNGAKALLQGFRSSEIKGNRCTRRTTSPDTAQRWHRGAPGPAPDQVGGAERPPGALRGPPPPLPLRPARPWEPRWGKSRSAHPAVFIFGFNLEASSSFWPPRRCPPPAAAPRRPRLCPPLPALCRSGPALRALLLLLPPGARTPFPPAARGGRALPLPSAPLLLSPLLAHHDLSFLDTPTRLCRAGHSEQEKRAKERKKQRQGGVSPGHNSGLRTWRSRCQSAVPALGLNGARLRDRRRLKAESRAQDTACGGPLNLGLLPLFYRTTGNLLFVYPCTYIHLVPMS